MTNSDIKEVLKGLHIDKPLTEEEIKLHNNKLEVIRLLLDKSPNVLVGKKSEMLTKTRAREYLDNISNTTLSQAAEWDGFHIFKVEQNLAYIEEHFPEMSNEAKKLRVNVAAFGYVSEEEEG